MHANDIIFLISVVVSADNFIADNQGKISFASIEDKLLLKQLMKGDECDCFIIGRKTYQEMPGKITKPYIILSHSYEKYKSSPQKIYTNTNNLYNVLDNNNLQKPLILGGAAIYEYFLKQNINIETRITKEENIMLHKGIPLPNIHLGKMIHTKKLSDTTTLLIYKNHLP